MLAVFCFSLYGCGGGGSGGSDSGSGAAAAATPTPTPVQSPTPTPTPVAVTGRFVDSAVEGLRYRTQTQQGTTNSDGEFLYIAGEEITFSIGDIDLPTISATSLITPLEVFNTTDFSNTSVANLARLLQSLDVDDDPSNGITIADQAHEMSMGLNIDFAATSFDTDVVNLIANSGSSRTALQTTENAVSHLMQTLEMLNAAAGCGNDHPLVGSTATFSTFQHNVSGDLRVVSNCRIEITNFNYDGGGPAVAFYGGTDGDYSSPIGFPLGAAINGRPYVNETITIDLPNGVTLNDFDGISVWCFVFDINFGDAIFGR